MAQRLWQQAVLHTKVKMLPFGAKVLYRLKTFERGSVFEAKMKSGFAVSWDEATSSYMVYAEELGADGKGRCDCASNHDYRRACNVRFDIGIYGYTVGFDKATTATPSALTSQQRIQRRL
jgi:hypothetical protein